MAEHLKAYSQTNDCFEKWQDGYAKLREETSAKISSQLEAEGLGEFEILLITRGRDPFKGHHAFPGGFVDYGEDPKNAVLRELKEECCVDGLTPKLITVHGDPARDPRKHIVTIAYHVEIEPTASIQAGDDAATANWYNLRKVWTDHETYKFAFDHREILGEFI